MHTARYMGVNVPVVPPCVQPIPPCCSIPCTLYVPDGARYDWETERGIRQGNSGEGKKRRGGEGRRGGTSLCVNAIEHTIPYPAFSS